MPNKFNFPVTNNEKINIYIADDATFKTSHPENDFKNLSGTTIWCIATFLWKYKVPGRPFQFTAHLTFSRATLVCLQLIKIYFEMSEILKSLFHL